MVNMKDKLETLAARYDEIQVRLSQPETLSDMDTWRRLMKEHADMEELMTAYGRYKTVLENVEQRIGDFWKKTEKITKSQLDIK